MAIYVIDNHPLMRDAIVMLLRRMQPDVEVVGLPQLSALEPAIAVHGHPTLLSIDLKLPDTVGLAGVRQLSAQYPETPLAVISATPADDMAQWCREAGAATYIEKTAEAAAISHALRPILKIDGDATMVHVETQLSKRQKQLLQMLDQGLSNREIAERLEISEHTVKVHLWRLFRRLGVKSRTQALHHARMNGLLAA